MKLHQSKKSYSLSESSQMNKLRFAICKVEGENIYMMNPWFKCRDYFSDWLVATRAGKRMPSIYGFVPDGSGDPIPLDSVTFALEGTKEGLDNIEANLETIAIAQGKGAEEPTIIYREESVMVVRFDKLWLTTTQHLSMLTLLLRTFTLTTNETGVDLHNFLLGVSKKFHTNQDGRFWAKACNGMNISDFVKTTVDRQDEIVSEKVGCLEKAFPNTSEVHGYGGFQSYIQFLSQPAFVGGTQFIGPFVKKLKQFFEEEDETKTA